LEIKNADSALKAGPAFFEWICYYQSDMEEKAKPAKLLINSEKRAVTEYQANASRKDS
jgi:hypothetical protein